MNARKAPASPEHEQNRKVTAEEYSVAVEAAQLVSVRLLKSEFDVAPEGMGRDRSSWKHSYDCQVTATAFDATRRLLTGMIVAEAGAKLSRKKVIGLKCRYMVTYAIDGEPSQEAASSFVKRVGAFAAYPYFRAHFAEVCSQAGVMLPPLPVLKQPRQKIGKASSS